MAFESLGSSEQTTYSQRTSEAQPLSQSGQLMGWLVYGALLLIGFGIGIVTGTERTKSTTVAKATKEKDDTKPESPKADPPKSTPKPTPDPTTTPSKETPSTAPKSDPKPPVPMSTTPKSDPKPPMPAVTTTPKVDPKTDPKPPVPVVATPPKTDPPAKKEELKAVSFKAEVLPVLRTHCLNCHGAGKGKPKGDVDLTTIDKIKKSPSPGKMLVIGMPEKSDIYTSITERDMPEGGKPKPSKEELLILKNWILTGAKERRRSVRGRKPANPR